MGKYNLKKHSLILFVLLSTALGLLFYITFVPPVLNQTLLSLTKEQLANNGVSSKFCIIIDYDQPIFRKRLWLIDTQTSKVLMNSWVGHSIKSGLFYATRFSNQPGSNISSKGSFLMAEKYSGKFGRSFRIKGLDSTNSNVYKRAIVFHPTATPKLWGFTIPQQLGYLSYGCFTLQQSEIDFMRNLSSNIFIYVHKTS